MDKSKLKCNLTFFSSLKLIVSFRQIENDDEDDDCNLIAKKLFVIDDIDNFNAELQISNQNIHNLVDDRFDRIDSETDEDSNDDIEDESDKHDRNQLSTKSLYEIYEPIEIEHNYLAKSDNKIRTTNIPERFQTRSIPVTKAKANEIRKESQWIYRNLYEIPTITKQDKSVEVPQPLAGTTKPRSAMNAIYRILNCIRNEKLSIPFLAYYRKEEYSPDLSINDLWLIFNWDEKWCKLNQRKQNLIELLNNMQEYQLYEMMNKPNESLPDDFRCITHMDIQNVQHSIQSFEEFNDYYIHFQLYYGDELTKMNQFLVEQERNTIECGDQNQNQELGANQTNNVNEEFEKNVTIRFRRFKSTKKDTYPFCRRSGIGKMATKFGLKPEQFGENISCNYRKHKIEQYENYPLEMAQKYVSKCFNTAENVLHAATFMVGKQLSCDPLVRKTVRQMFYERATVTVKPTKKGQKEIDESHACYTMKYLRNKPISSFTGEQFIHLNAAKNNDLVNMIISLNNNKDNLANNEKPFEQYFNEIKYLYQKDEFLKALYIAFDRFLYPDLVKEFIAKILTETQHTIIQHCANKLASYLAIGPYVPNFVQAENNHNDYDDDFSIHNGIRIIGFAYSHCEEEASYCALIDGNGHLVDFIKLKWTSNEKDYDKLQKFIVDKKPHVIALGTHTVVIKHIRNEIIAMIRNLHETKKFPLINVELIDSELSSIFMNSKQAETDFHDHPLKLRQAISLARQLQNPLLEFAQLCTVDEEILCLKFHPLQDIVSNKTLLNALYAEFVNRVNDVGVDINQCLVHPYKSSIVQFIAGFGPHKASQLFRTLKKQQPPLLMNRAQLYEKCKIDENIFINCAGFIRINKDSFSTDFDNDTCIEFLDSTRIHPESYRWAWKMAIDALHHEECDDHVVKEFEEIIENPKKLYNIDLDKFNEKLHQQGYNHGKQTLQDIRSELIDRYKDRRIPYQPPNNEEMFQLLTKENRSTLYIGRLIQVRVIDIVRQKPTTEQLKQAKPIHVKNELWKCSLCLKNYCNDFTKVWDHINENQCPGQAIAVRVCLENDLTGIIWLEFLSDNHVIDPLTRVKADKLIHCRILKLDMERFSLELTCRTSDLNNVDNRFKLVKDNHYDFDEENCDFKKKEIRKKESEI
ncbi:transcription elongation factor spt6-like protein [Dermatophagoides farinae]|uniref:Transcription elongation factor spt6-like protein n=1 Tax=Dermatophagoides farinae TaxID=6954 RepID=A0A9D4SF15_DERFA|nr:transcription elongation factor spt6-like protein [Dermatophagoides farinae]